MPGVNDLCIKQNTSDPKLHRWKTDPQTPFAPSIDVAIYIDKYHGISSKLRRIIEKAGVGSYEESITNNNFFEQWTRYNLFAWDSPVIDDLRSKIYQTYLDYCSSLNVVAQDRDNLLIRGWAVRLEPGEPIGMHSHSLHDYTFVSGNMSLGDYNTTTDYWLPLYSLYDGPFECQNTKGTICMFPSWLQHGVANNSAGTVRFSLAFDLFIKDHIKFVLKTESQSSDLATILEKAIAL